MEKVLSKTADCLNQIEEVYKKYWVDYKAYQCAPDADKALFDNPMLHLAETIYMEQPDWAEDLAKYLCVLCHIKKLDVDVEINSR